jgi:putative membrane protein
MMAIKIALFIHVVSVAAWFGGISMMAMYLRDATRSNNLETMSYALGKAQRWNLTMFIPTAVLVLLTGIYMLMQYANKPLWLLVKERFGSLFVVLFILLIAFYGRKLLSQVKAGGVDSAKGQAILKRYIMLLNLSLLCMVILIFFVTVKIGG